MSEMLMGDIPYKCSYLEEFLLSDHTAYQLSDFAEKNVDESYFF